MFSTKNLTRNMALAGAVTILLGSSAFAQDRNYPRTDEQRSDRGYASRTVDGTVASVEHERDGDRVRLTNGMDLLVPDSITSMNEGRSYSASTLQPGDVVRMSVYSREGDGRDAQVRSLEILQRSNVGYNNDHRMNGTVVSVNRRGHSLVMQTRDGQRVRVDLRNYTGRGTTSAGTFRRGDRISVSGRMNRGMVIADDVRMNDTFQHDQYGHRH
jgi:hypothetical protein